MRLYFQVNNQQQETSGDADAMCCFLMFVNSLQAK